MKLYQKEEGSSQGHGTYAGMRCFMHRQAGKQNNQCKDLPVQDADDVKFVALLKQAGWLIAPGVCITFAAQNPWNIYYDWATPCSQVSR